MHLWVGGGGGYGSTGGPRVQLVRADSTQKLGMINSSCCCCFAHLISSYAGGGGFPGGFQFQAGGGGFPGGLSLFCCCCVVCVFLLPVMCRCPV